MKSTEFVSSAELTEQQKKRLSKITEVEIGPDQQLGLVDKQILNQLKPLSGDIEGYPLFGLRFSNQIVFAIKDKVTEQILSVLVVEDFDILSNSERKAVQVKRSWTPEEFRNKGFSTAMYDGLTRHGYRVVSDAQLTETALAIWNKLKLRHRIVKAFDVTTNSYTDKDPASNVSVLFVLENVRHTKSAILEDTKLFTVWSDGCP